jgi:hypothetical protein
MSFYTWCRVSGPSIVLDPFAGKTSVWNEQLLIPKIENCGENQAVAL